MDIEKLQQTINREAWQRYGERYGAGTAGASVEKDLADVAEAYNRKHGDAKHVATPATDGPLTQQAKRLAAAISRARAGQVGEANGGSGRVFGVHKLARYVVGGREG
jgi:hypothetical protein